MREKLRNKKGFTLAELLIVVAIIAILIAIMVPVFGTSRANAIQAKDASNVRSAYSEAVTDAMAKNDFTGTDGKLAVTIYEGDLGKDSKTTVSIEANGDIKVSTTGASEPIIIDVDSDVEVKLGGTVTP